MGWGYGERTPSYEGTRTPSPTAPPLTLTKIVWADAELAAAARTSGVESFIVMVDVASSGRAWCFNDAVVGVLINSVFALTFKI